MLDSIQFKHEKKVDATSHVSVHFVRNALKSSKMYINDIYISLGQLPDG
jgi:hypothetical protein